MIRWKLPFAIAAVLALAGPAAARADARSDAAPDELAPPPSSPGLEDFKRGLSPHGEWIESPGSGPVWRPRVAAGWRPYYDGHWARTTRGWFWVSAEPWAWATYHYGRWAHDPALGWIWAPGYEWAPAWVTWRAGGGVVGWAPLPPAFPVFAAHRPFFFAWTFVPAVQLVGFPVVRVAFAPVFVRRFFFVTHPVLVTHHAHARRVFHGIAPPRRGGGPHRLAPPASGFRGGFAPPPRSRSRHR